MVPDSECIQGLGIYVDFFTCVVVMTCISTGGRDDKQGTETTRIWKKCCQPSSNDLPRILMANAKSHLVRGFSEAVKYSILISLLLTKFIEYRPGLPGDFL